MIRAITVDFWGTLVAAGPLADDHYRLTRLTDFAKILASAGITVTQKALTRGYARSARELAWVWSDNRDIPVERHVIAILEGAERNLGGRVAPPVVEALIEAYARPALAVPPPPDPGARDALLVLAGRGLKLAVVSNTMRTPGRALRRVLDGHGLLEPFAHLSFSDEMGVRKPAAEIFHRTLAQIGVEPDEAVHVGDDPILDVHGARCAGLRTIQVTGQGPRPGPSEPDLRIRGLEQLPAAVAQLS